MGLINDSGSRTLLFRTSRMWGESTLFLLAVSLAPGCTSRPEPMPADSISANMVVKTSGDVSPAPAAATHGGATPGEITSTGSAEGHTHFHFAFLPGVQEGDLIHVMADERVVATALITAIDAVSATALVTGLTDRTRLVAVGDVAVRLAPEDVLPASATPTTPVPVSVETVAAETVAADVAPAAVVESAPPPSERPPTQETSAPVVVATEETSTSAPAAVPSAASTSPSTSVSSIEGLTPEVRARLSAERAYFELATRVLRLPDAGPELTELQAHLRTELAALELLP